MTMRGKDRLSALGDNLLLRILYYVPAKEAASTSALSRRWGSLWRSTGAVNLVVRVRKDGSEYGSWDRRRQEEGEEAFFSRRAAFVRAAGAALSAAADAPISRLTLRLEGSNDAYTRKFLHTRRIRWGAAGREREELVDVVGAVVSHPAARRVEELRIAVVHDSDDSYASKDYETRTSVYGMYSLDSLPYETLRVLDLTRCTLREGSAAAVAAFFPHLATLQLRFCLVETPVLQSVMDAAPGLATVRLDCVLFLAREKEPVLRLRCPAAIALVMEMCLLEASCRCWAIEVEAPRLRSFKYKGNLRPFSLRTPALDMVRTDLHFFNDQDHQNSMDGTTRTHFWQFIQNFSNARVLKVKMVNNLDHVAAVGRESRAEHLRLFLNVERLELEGVHDPNSKKAAVAIANLLLCCPALRYLRLKLNTVASPSDKNYDGYGREFLERKDRLDYQKSLDRSMCRCRPSEPIISTMDDDRVSDIPGLRGRSFACLQNNLRKVGLQFRWDGLPNCFGVQLMKFFAENAMFLEELSFDSGNHRLSEHRHLGIERWLVAPNSSKVHFKSKNLSENSWEFSRNLTEPAMDAKTCTKTFTVKPLQR